VIAELESEDVHKEKKADPKKAGEKQNVHLHKRHKRR
jgi:hypothetical protein